MKYERNETSHVRINKGSMDKRGGFTCKNDGPKVQTMPFFYNFFNNIFGKKNTPNLRTKHESRNYLTSI